MKSKILSADLIWENMKKQMWLLALIFLAFVFVYPLSLFHSFDQWNNYMDLTTAEITKLLLLFIRVDLANSGFIIVTAAAVANGFFGFLWLHSRQKTDFYHSLPIRREALFWNQIVIGVVFYLVPEIIAALLGLCICASQGYFSMEIVSAMAGTVALHLLAYLLVYVLAILAMLLTGIALVGLLGALGFLVYFPAVTYLLEGYMQTFFTTYMGYSSSAQSFWDRPSVRFGSPIGWYERLMQEMDFRGNVAGSEIIGAVIICVLLFLLALWIYKRRPSESTGKAMVFKGFGKVVKFLVEIPVSLLVGLLAYEMAPYNSRLPWFVCGLLIGLVLSHGIMEIIYQLDFRKFFKHKLEMGIELALVAVIVVLFATDMTGYDSYLPKQEDLEYVSFSPSALSSEDRVIISRNPEDNSLEVRYAYDVSASFMELQPDDQIYDLLQQFQKKRRQFHWSESYSDEEDLQMKYMEVVYRLKNGKDVYRKYVVAMDQELQADMDMLWNRGDFRNGMYLNWKNWDDKKEYLMNIYWESLDDSQELYSANEQGRQEFMDALQKDVQNADMSTYMEYPVGKVQLNYGDLEIKNPNVIASDSFLIYPGFTNVMNLLEKKGARVVTDLSKEDIQSIVVEKYSIDSTGTYESSEKEYRNKDDIQRLVPDLVYNGYSSFQFPETETDIGAEVTRRNREGDTIVSYFGFVKGKVPEEFQ